MKYSIIILVFLICGITTAIKSQNLNFVKLTCNGIENPIFIDHSNPSFTWVISAPGFNRSQSLYQLLVAQSPELLNEKSADIWNSGKVLSKESTFIKYAGAPLKAFHTYYWKVKIWDEKGVSSSWSPVQHFTIGLQEKEENWGKSAWIALSKDTRTSEHRFREYLTGTMSAPVMVEGFAAAYFRKDVKVAKKIEKAHAYICGLGYYELYINGQKVGDHVLDPAPSNYEKQAYYVGYDITKQLKRGKNALGIIIGNGFYGQNISWKNDPESDKDLAYGQPAVRLLVKVQYSDGSTAEFYTNEQWKESTGPIVFNNVYGGDTYDARHEIEGWNTSKFNDAKWLNAKVVKPELEKVSPQMIPPIKKLKEFEPQKVFKGIDGEWIVDFGQNIAGWVKINVKEKRGQLIEIIATEALLTNGKDVFQGSTGGGANGMPQIYKYICKGTKMESWEPKFSYHGFRYVKIKGISSEPDVNMIKAVLVATDIQETGSFTSSDELLNKMHKISKWTIVDNMHGIPEDCPHREKCGWLGDAHAFCEYALYNYDLYNFYTKYMEDVRTQMRPTKGHNNPEIKFNVPTMIAPGKRTSGYAKLDWGIATMYLPWYNYVYYGDTAIVKEYYKEMKELTRFYLSFKDDNGVIQDGMGDWCPPLWDRKGNPSAMECDPIISANAYFYDVLGIMERFAKMNDDTGFEAEMNREKEALKVAFNKAFLVDLPNSNYKWYKSQTATVQALQFGLVYDNMIQNVINGLKHDIVTNKKGHHSTGIHGNRYIYTVLTKYGESDLAYQLLTTPDFPSQTYVMNAGFTTWPERQFVWEKMEGPTNSLNHPMHSGFAAYFFESLGGIKSTSEKAGYKVFTVNPIFPQSINATTVTIPTPYGNINHSWNKTNTNFKAQLTVPFNTKAQLVLTEKEFETLKVNGESWAKGEILHLDKKSDQYAIELGSGMYVIEY